MTYIQPDDAYQQQYDQGQQGHGAELEEAALVVGAAYLLARHGDSWWLFFAIYGLLYVMSGGWFLPAVVLGISAVLYGLYRLAHLL